MTAINCDFCGKLIRLSTTMPPEPNVRVQFENYSFTYDCCEDCGIGILYKLGKDNDAVIAELKRGSKK